MFTKEGNINRQSVCWWWAAWPWDGGMFEEIGPVRRAQQAPPARRFKNRCPTCPYDPAGTERLRSGIAVAKNDPSTAKWLVDEGACRAGRDGGRWTPRCLLRIRQLTISEEGRQTLSRNAEWLRCHPACS